ncbi:hypothetical protein ACIBSW_11975 [Actinoplanes sp. NPDC049668]|uniref:hypothetical protein n=1 Tax=unclassified Actinoplanes TaxID=2626549 RepID=UPI0033A1B654
MKRFPKAQRRKIQRLQAGALRGDLVDAYNLALELEQVGDDAQAERWHRVAASAGDPQALNNLGAFLHEAGREQEALTFFVAAAEAGDVFGARNAAVLYEKRGEDEAAERWFRAAASGGDHLGGAWLAHLLVRTERYEEARPLLVAAAEGGHAISASVLADRHECAGDDDEAEYWYRVAVACGDLESRNDLALLLGRTGRSPEALVMWVAGADSGHAYCAYNLAIELEEAGDLREAKRRYRQALTAWEADAENLDGQSAYCAAVACDELDDHRGALAWYRRAAALGDPEAADELRQRALANSEPRQRTSGHDRNRRGPAQRRGSTRP